VDYWNSLGWKDVYSNADYSKRQQQYGNIFQLNSVYTPQAIVNGETEFTGSNTGKLHEAVENALSVAASTNIEVSAKTTDKVVNISYHLSASSSNVLNIALVQLHAQSNVQKGENSGKLLHHVNVVRAFKTVTAQTPQGTIMLQLPAGVTAKDCKIIAYLQDAQAYKITAATAADIE